MKIKTVLAQGAPWYPKGHKYRTKPGRSSPAQTTKNFERWLKRQKIKDRKLMKERHQCESM